MSEAAIPEPDRIEGAPHPRDTRHLIGQDHAEAGFLDAYAADRLHHAWLLTGPLGVVIATLAVLGVFLSWFFNIIDLRQALWVLVGIAGVAAARTIVAAVVGS